MDNGNRSVLISLMSCHLLTVVVVTIIIRGRSCNYILNKFKLFIFFHILDLPAKGDNLRWNAAELLVYLNFDFFIFSHFFGFRRLLLVRFSEYSLIICCYWCNYFSIPPKFFYIVFDFTHWRVQNSLVQGARWLLNFFSNFIVACIT